MKVTYHAIDNGRLTATEIASLRGADSDEVVGSAQIVYFSNGLKNIAYIERVFVRPEHQSAGHGGHLLREVIRRIEGKRCTFSPDALTGVIATTIPEALDPSGGGDGSSEKIHEIILICSGELTGWYGGLGFEPVSDGVMRRVTAPREHSSLL